MVNVQHLIGSATSFPVALSQAQLSSASASSNPRSPPSPHDSTTLSVLSYNVLLPNSVDGWWHYKMYLPPLTTDDTSRVQWSTWEYRRDLLRKRIQQVDADVVCFQEVAPVSFEDDFRFMMSDELGYDGFEMFKRGRFRPATFWKTSRVELASPPVHKDRVLLTAFRRRTDSTVESASTEQQHQKQDDPATATATTCWYVLNCHLQAGNQGRRRVRQINEGVRAAMTLARKLKDPVDNNPERDLALIACGDFNGGAECGAVRYLEDGYVDETFREDGDPVVSNRKELPLEQPMVDAVASVDHQQRGGSPPPATLVVNELISLLVKTKEKTQSATATSATPTPTAYEDPELSDDVVERLTRIYDRLATHETSGDAKGGGNGKKKVMMNAKDAEGWLVAINGELGRGSEYREAATLMGSKSKKGCSGGSGSDSDNNNNNDDYYKKRLPRGGLLSLEGFLNVYRTELRGGKFWGVAHDLAVLGEPLPTTTAAGNTPTFQARYDRIYCSSSVQPVAVMDFASDRPCPNDDEPSDHLPVAAAFTTANTIRS